ncbi:peptidoglycan-binding protein [Kitasatospora sp. NBC_01539]|uniref:peptidoglycan-binding protein n=1 Tax=Kitasatospora sp. NBC_01539 TaxID=2903577 RepID=UPI00386031B2
MSDLISEPEQEFDPDEPEDTAPAGRSPTTRRRRALLAVAASAGLVACGVVAAAAFVTSPAERAAGAAAPPDTLLTAQATMQVLTRSTVARGQVYPPTRYDVTPVPTSAEITQLYVSALAVKAGDRVDNGQLLAEVSGRPLVVLRGAVPAYRDLRPGSSGPDVAQLQAALADLGHGRGTDDEGDYGPGTAAAVTAYYRGLGRQAPTAGPAARQAVDAARQAVEADQRQIDLLTAQQAAAAPVGPAEGAAVAPPEPLAEARARLAEDTAALAEAQALDGPTVPAGEVVFVPALPAVVTTVNAPVGAPVAGALLSLASGDLVVTGELPPGQAPGIRAGMAVEILSEATGTTVKGRVAEVGTPTTAPPAARVIPIGGAAAAPAAGGTAGASPGPGPQVSAYVPLRIEPAEPLPAAFDGQNVRITVVRSATAEPVLSVPVAAVFTDASGRTAVTRIDSLGRRITVPVTTGVNADGQVAVTPVQSAQLQANDPVVVGR